MTLVTTVQAAINVVDAVRPNRVVAPGQAALEAMEEINTFLRMPSLEIAEWDATSMGHLPMGTSNYSPALLDALNGSVLVDDVCWPELQQDRQARTWDLCEIDREESRLYQDVLLPNGYVEGVYLPLFHGNRYVGMLTGNTDDPRPPDDDAREALAVLAPTLAEHIVRTRRRRAEGVVRGRVLLDERLRVLGEDPADAAPMVAAIRAALAIGLGTGRPLHRFCLWPEGEEMPVQVRVEDARGARGRHHVMWRREGFSAGLSRRQVEVVTGVVDGLTNTEIGARLFASPRTVSKHVENILVKLGVGTRSGITRVAMLEGIYLAETTRGESGWDVQNAR